MRGAPPFSEFPAARKTPVPETMRRPCSATVQNKKRAAGFQTSRRAQNTPPLPRLKTKNAPVFGAYLCIRRKKARRPIWAARFDAARPRIRCGANRRIF